MNISLHPGLQGTAAVKVTAANTAAAMKSGSLPVFATPAMCALMEEAACAALDCQLEQGSGSVGISLNITHDRATLLGEEVIATAVLTEISGRKLTFAVEAHDAKGIIGRGSHERFLINNEKFLAKAGK